MNINTSFLKQNISELNPIVYKNDQVRYSLGMKGWINIRKLITLIMWEQQIHDNLIRCRKSIS